MIHVSLCVACVIQVPVYNWCSSDSNLEQGQHLGQVLRKSSIHLLQPFSVIVDTRQRDMSASAIETWKCGYKLKLFSHFY